MNNQEIDEECISFLTNHQYIKNPSPTTLLSDFEYKIPIQKFICYCVGIIDGQRHVHCIRILKKSPSEKISTMLIQWFSPNDLADSISFWVSSGVTLKRNFFLHDDQLNFFRSTFIYYPEIQQYFRLSSIQNFITIEEYNPMKMKILNTPIKWYIYKRKIDYKPEKYITKRKKDFQKSLTKFKNKQNMNHFIQETYPNLYTEIQNALKEK